MKLNYIPLAIIWLGWAFIIYRSNSYVIDSDEIVVKEGHILSAECSGTRGLSKLTISVSYSEVKETYILKLPESVNNTNCTEEFALWVRNKRFQASFFEHIRLGVKVADITFISTENAIKQKIGGLTKFFKFIYVTAIASLLSFPFLKSFLKKGKKKKYWTLTHNC